MRQKKRFARANSKGFTLVELMVAMFVLAVGVLGGMVMIILGMTRDNTNRMDTTATNAAQAVMEQIAAVPANVDTNVVVTDCVPTARTVTTTGSTGGSGATLMSDGSGNVDFSAAPVANYQTSFTVCGNNGLQITYDVRWRITKLPSGGKLVIVAAGHPSTDNKTRAMAYIPPVTLRTIVGL
ncbi:MAG TPA: prepilin-type N-terminal cleavage/methylation domain-containing protein [Candidatus Angelobacter sp.]|nr:prepilin-type N-terminal cleavage/methylation domain-containing protein [Candidatus Angelobacter sp.]